MAGRGSWKHSIVSLDPGTALATNATACDTQAEQAVLACDFSGISIDGPSTASSFYNCYEPGHMSRDCPSKSAGGNRSGGASCYGCGETGPISRDCPSKSSGGGNRDGGSNCYNCGEPGHISRDCPTKSSGGSNCYNCGEPGHISRECPLKSAEGDADGGNCYHCKEPGHLARDCPTKPEGEPAHASYMPQYLDVNDIYSLSVKSGVNVANFDGLEIEVAGVGDRPPPMKSFDEIGLPRSVYDCLQKFRWPKPLKPFPIQKYAIPIILEGRDLMACAQTGSGKTIAYLLPIIKKLMDGPAAETAFANGTGFPQALVLVPTRELCLQVHDNCRALLDGSPLTSERIHGSIRQGHLLQQLRSGVNLLVATVGRLKDFVKRGYINLSKVKYMVLDEADRMLDQGFLSDVAELIECTSKDRQLCMFSATFTDDIQSLAQEYLNNYLFLTVGRIGSANPDVKQEALEVRGCDKLDRVMQLLEEFRGQDGFGDRKVLVFVETKLNTNFVALSISQRGIPCTNIHGDRPPEERENAFKEFRTGSMPIMVTTNVSARGVDVSGIELVINYDLPRDDVQYVHRIGRTGRCGNVGKSISFFDPETDMPMARHLLNCLQTAQAEVPQWLEVYAEQAGFYGGSAQTGRSRDIRRGVARAVEQFDAEEEPSASYRPQAASIGANDDDWS